ncbi:hypothetical protein [Niveispirillum sp. KHB5.9]|uniref:hypothetical protein n=1 Tax=Niveispirillum sp. KHB5.9 TaxID=3400269 RepID=UPI003A8A12F4
MVNASEASQTYVLSIEGVRKAISRLEKQFIHQHFAGYLAILRARHLDTLSPVRMSDILEFHDRYLRVTGAPEGAPYVRPFTQGRGLQQMNRNVAGSYAASSVREQGKIGKVISVVGSGRNATYDLHVNHASLALEIFLQNQKVSAAALVGFLYRDYGFKLAHRQMSSVVALFRNEFGMRASDPEEARIFDTLFLDDSNAFEDEELIIVEGVSK